MPPPGFQQPLLSMELITCRGVGSNFEVVRPDYEDVYNGCFNKLINIVRSTTSMRSMLLLGGSGGMPPQEIFENEVL